MFLRLLLCTLLSMLTALLFLGLFLLVLLLPLLMLLILLLLLEVLLLLTLLPLLLLLLPSLSLVLPLLLSLPTPFLRGPGIGVRAGGFLLLIFMVLASRPLLETGPADAPRSPCRAVDRSVSNSFS
jgi:hypothetical protein